MSDNNELRYIASTMPTTLQIKLACVGLGQFGGKLVDLLAAMRDREGQPQYNCGAVNSFDGDLRALRNIPRKHQYQLRGAETGGGRMPEMIQSVLLDEEHENQRYLWSFLDEIASDAPYLMIAAGLGGGTGTGLILGLLQWIKQGLMPRPCGLILTLPRPEDGPRQQMNAAMALRDIIQFMNEQPRGDALDPETLRHRINSLIFLDNGLLYREWQANGQVGDWMTYGNAVVAEGFHEMNLIASNSAGDVNFDAADFGRLLLYSGGCVSYAKLPFRPIDQYDRLAEAVRQTVVQGRFSSGYDFDTATYWGGMVYRTALHSANDAKVRDSIEAAIRQITPASNDYKLGMGRWNHSTSCVYLGISGLDVPRRAWDILKAAREETERAAQAEQDRQERQRALLDSLGPVRPTSPASGGIGKAPATAGNPFAPKLATEAARKNPFDKK